MTGCQSVCDSVLIKFETKRSVGSPISHGKLEFEIMDVENLITFFFSIIVYMTNEILPLHPSLTNYTF